MATTIFFIGLGFIIAEAVIGTIKDIIRINKEV